MPRDSKGAFHNNIGRAMAADKNSMPAPAAKAPRPMAAAPEPTGDDGSGAAEHLKAYHDAMGGGKAMLIHHDGINTTSHHIGEDGEVSGPHDHANLEELKSSMDQFLDEEAEEGMSAEHDMATGRIKDVY